MERGWISLVGGCQNGLVQRHMSQPRHQFQCLLSSAVPSQLRVVREGNDPLMEIGGVQNIDLALEIQKSVG